MDPLLKTAFTAVESDTALNPDILNRPYEAVTALESLKTALEGSTVTITDDDGTLTSPTPFVNATYTVTGDDNSTINGSDIIASLDTAIAQATASASSLSDQIVIQMGDLMSNVQTYGHLNELRLELEEINMGNVGDDVTDYFGSIMLPHLCAKVAARRMDRIDPALDADQLESINLRTVRDEVAQIVGYTTKMQSQYVTEPAALQAAFDRLNGLTEAALLLEYLKLPDTYPVLDIVAGTGLRPVIDALKYGAATDLGFATPPGIDPTNPVYPVDADGYPVDDLYGNAVTAPGELPDPPVEADPTP